MTHSTYPFCVCFLLTLIGWYRALSHCMAGLDSRYCVQKPRALGKACVLQGKQSLYPLYGREHPCSQTHKPNNATVMMNENNNLLLCQSMQQVVFKGCKIRVNQHTQNWCTKHTQPKRHLWAPTIEYPGCLRPEITEKEFPRQKTQRTTSSYMGLYLSCLIMTNFPL